MLNASGSSRGNFTVEIVKEDEIFYDAFLERSEAECHIGNNLEGVKNGEVISIYLWCNNRLLEKYQKVVSDVERVTFGYDIHGNCKEETHEVLNI